MIRNKKVVVVMPAYNAEHTIEKTWREVVAQEVVDLVVVVDDHSKHATVERARRLPKTVVHEHPKNRGYGANQKTCYRLALGHGADIVIMVHPDYQYTRKLDLRACPTTAARPSVKM
jgi:glycosyltransferase involved in cell wall biosynthesis